MPKYIIELESDEELEILKLKLLYNRMAGSYKRANSDEFNIEYSNKIESDRKLIQEKYNKLLTNMEETYNYIVKKSFSKEPDDNQYLEEGFPILLNDFKLKEIKNEND